MSSDRLMPLKRVMGELGVSRPTLWRASKAVPGFPAPTLVQGRLFWRADEMPKLREAMAQFAGRGVFEREQLLTKLRAERDRVRSRRVRRSAPRASEQSDLFDWAFSEGE